MLTNLTKVPGPPHEEAIENLRNAVKRITLAPDAALARFQTRSKGAHILDGVWVWTIRTSIEWPEG